MALTNKNAKLFYDSENKQLFCQGSWSVSTLESLASSFQQFLKFQNTQLIINGSELEYFDSAAALALYDFIKKLKEKNNEISLLHFSKQQENLLHLIDEKNEAITYQAAKPTSAPFLENLGRETLNKTGQVSGLLHLIGDLCCNLFKAFEKWRNFRFPNIVSNVNSAGLQALPILALLSFLIGVVLAYQMGLQLKTYGATTFIAYLSGMAIFREFAPLITAIIVAGRSSSAFTAQLGNMKINEEIDALETMGLSPTELLVMPKFIGLSLVFPLLIFWSDLFSLFGAMVMSQAQLDISYVDYLSKLKESVGLKQMMLGLYKAPAFSLIIALVGCFQGFSVKANAESIGSQTTKSVVQALFLIIIADSVYSVVYSWMGL